jgi:hypothetical protein
LFVLYFCVLICVLPVYTILYCRLLLVFYIVLSDDLFYSFIVNVHGLSK